MKLLFVAKRRPQQRDLLDRPYGRFHHIPVELARRGHEVAVLLCSHQGLPTERRESAGVAWMSRDLRTPAPHWFLRSAKDAASSFGPDWIIGCSDAWYGPLARHLASCTGARLAVDAYDNYEAYMPWNLPLRQSWRRSIRRADLVTAAGPQLAGLMQRYRHGGRRVEVLPMAPDPQFFPRDRAMCRTELDLPLNRPLLGYLGSWSQSRGSRLLIEMFRLVRAQHPDVQLVLSGRPPADVQTEPGVIVTGYLSDVQLPALVSALDVACVVTANTSFGRYSYPAKLYEAMACGVPVVASATDAIRWMLEGREAHLAHLDDVEHFAKRVIEQLENPHADYGGQPRWSEIAHRFSDLLGRAS